MLRSIRSRDAIGRIYKLRHCSSNSNNNRIGGIGGGNGVDCDRVARRSLMSVVCSSNDGREEAVGRGTSLSSSIQQRMQQQHHHHDHDEDYEDEDGGRQNVQCAQQ